MNDLLNILESNNQKIANITERLDNLKKMWAATEIMSKLEPKYAGFLYDDSIEVATIFQSSNVTITYGIWRKNGKIYPNHSHNESIEYLIVTNGRFTIQFDGGFRVVGKGDCMSLPPKTLHSCLALEDNSEMFGICIPPEKAYVREE